MPETEAPEDEVAQEESTEATAHRMDSEDPSVPAFILSARVNHQTRLLDLNTLTRSNEPPPVSTSAPARLTPPR